MNKINIDKWKEFNLSDLFDIKLSSDDLQPNKLDTGEYPLISSGKTNNGIVMYIKKQENATLFRKNSITIDMFGKSFFQEKEFYCVSHGRVNILIPKFSINKKIGLYLACVIENSFIDKYSFAVMCSSSLLKKEKIKLPVNNSGKIDWNYIERYTTKIETKCLNNLNHLNNTKNFNKKCEISEWKDFAIRDLFEIKRPVSRSQSSYEIGDIPFVASGNYNNGVLKKLKPKLNEKLDKGNCITVSPVDGSAFYQSKDFLGRGGAGSSIILLYNSNLNKNNGLFIATVVRKVCSKYIYNNMGSKESIGKEIIKLPVDKDGKPNWNFMSNYIQNLEKKELNILNQMRNIA